MAFSLGPHPLFLDVGPRLRRPEVVDSKIEAVRGGIRFLYKDLNADSPLSPFLMVCNRELLLKEKT